MTEEVGYQNRHDPRPALQDFYHNRFNQFSLFAERLQKIISNPLHTVLFSSQEDKYRASISVENDKNAFYACVKDNFIDAFFGAMDMYEMEGKGE